MEIAKIGEFGLIDRLTKDIPLHNASTLAGVGDDCAVIAQTQGHSSLLTTDLLMEGIHFDLVYTPLKHLGYKAAQVNFSDVYAMNGFPQQLVVGLALSKRFQVEDVEELYAGLCLACLDHGVDIVGGDTTASVTGLAISIACLGETVQGAPVKRSGAHPTDLICVSGNLGAAYMGLQIMEREKAIFLSQTTQEGKTRRENEAAEWAAQPDFQGREYLLQRLLRPEARRDIVEQLARAGLTPTSMIDISDGLSSELHHLCKASRTGCRIYEERIPIDYQTAAAAEEFNISPTTCALHGGEDYEMLFTLPLSDYEKIQTLSDVHVIGHVTDQADSLILVTPDGGEHVLPAQGFTQF